MQTATRGPLHRPLDDAVLFDERFPSVHPPNVITISLVVLGVYVDGKHAALSEVITTANSDIPATEPASPRREPLLDLGFAGGAATGVYRPRVDLLLIRIQRYDRYPLSGVVQRRVVHLVLPVLNPINLSYFGKVDVHFLSFLMASHQSSPYPLMSNSNGTRDGRVLATSCIILLSRTGSSELASKLSWVFRIRELPTSCSASSNPIHIILL